MARVPFLGGKHEREPPDVRVRSYGISIMIVLAAIGLLAVAAVFFQGAGAIAVGIGYAPVARAEGWGGPPDREDRRRARRAMIVFDAVGWSLVAVAVLGVAGAVYREARITVRRARRSRVDRR
jgi:hypothetical protein